MREDKICRYDELRDILSFSLSHILKQGRGSGEDEREIERSRCDEKAKKEKNRVGGKGDGEKV